MPFHQPKWRAQIVTDVADKFILLAVQFLQPACIPKQYDFTLLFLVSLKWKTQNLVGFISIQLQGLHLTTFLVLADEAVEFLVHNPYFAALFPKERFSLVARRVRGRITELNLAILVDNQDWIRKSVKCQV